LPTAIVEADNKKLEGLARQLRALGAKDVTLLEDEVEEVENVMLPGQERAFRVQ
jgi:16S rRNA G527 N7-methylase RsmG